MPAIGTVTLMPGGEQLAGAMPLPAPDSVSGPLVSCLMVSRGNRAAVADAIAGYRRQTYPNRELVILCDRADNLIQPLLARLGDPTIRFHLTESHMLGELRNRSIALAEGPLLCQWDDDDLYHARRIELQAAALQANDAAACFILRWTLWQPSRRRLAVSGPRLWEGSMLAWRGALPQYPPLARGEDSALVDRLRSVRRLVAIDVPTAYVYVGHATNTCGADHYDTLLANADLQVADADYDDALAELAAMLPIRARLARLADGAPPAG